MTTIIEKLLATTDEGRRELARQQLLVSVSDQIWEVLEKEGFTCTQLADRLQSSTSNISQMLSGRRNMTLGTLSDIAYETGYQVRVHLRKDGHGAAVIPANWCVHGKEVKTLESAAPSRPVRKLRYETKELDSGTASADFIGSHANKSAAA